GGGGSPRRGRVTPGAGHPDGGTVTPTGAELLRWGRGRAGDRLDVLHAVGGHLAVRHTEDLGRGHLDTFTAVHHRVEEVEQLRLAVLLGDVPDDQVRQPVRHG